MADQTGAVDLEALKQLRSVVKRAGHVPVNPTENNGLADGWIGYMRLALAQLVTCEAVYLLPGWQRSKGCRCEAQVAGWLHLVDFGALAAAQAEAERLNTWDGLLSILDEHYPAEVFEKSPDPGARIVTLARHLAAAREENERLREAAQDALDDVRQGFSFAAEECLRAALAREDGG